MRRQWKGIEWNGMEEQVPIMFLDLSLFSLFLELRVLWWCANKRLSLLFGQKYVNYLLSALNLIFFSVFRRNKIEKVEQKRSFKFTTPPPFKGLSWGFRDKFHWIDTIRILIQISSRLPYYQSSTFLLTNFTFVPLLFKYSLLFERYFNLLICISSFFICLMCFDVNVCNIYFKARRNSVHK